MAAERIGTAWADIWEEGVWAAGVWTPVGGEEPPPIGPEPDGGGSFARRRIGMLQKTGTALYRAPRGS